MFDIKVCFIVDMPCSSDSTSDQDGYGPSTSLDSNMDGRRMWQRSGANLDCNLCLHSLEKNIN